MLSPQEALMMKAAYDEQERTQQQNTAGLLGAAGGGLAGLAVGSVPHNIGKMLGAKPTMRPGFRAAGLGIGALVGGLLGGGVAGVMKSESAAARGMAQMQAGGDINEYELKQIEDEIAAVYNNPSRYM